MPLTLRDYAPFITPAPDPTSGAQVFLQSSRNNINRRQLDELERSNVEQEAISREQEAGIQGRFEPTHELAVAQHGLNVRQRNAAEMAEEAKAAAVAVAQARAGMPDLGRYTSSLYGVDLRSGGQPQPSAPQESPIYRGGDPAAFVGGVADRAIAQAKAARGAPAAAFASSATGPATPASGPGRPPQQQAPAGDYWQQQADRAAEGVVKMWADAYPEEAAAPGVMRQMIEMAPTAIQNTGSPEEATQFLADWYKMHLNADINRRRSFSGGVGAGGKEYRAGRQFAANAFMRSKAIDRIEGYKVAESALGKLRGAKNNPALYTAVIYGMAQSNDPGARLTNKDVEMAPGFVDLLSMTYEQLDKHFKGQAGEQRMKQALDALTTTKALISRQALRDYEAMSVDRDAMNTDGMAWGHDSYLSQWATMPWYSEVRERDGGHTRLRDKFGRAETRPTGMAPEPSDELPDGFVIEEEP